MNKTIRYIAIITVLLAAGTFFFWQQNKKAIIKKSISSAISKKTDSLYFIKYDSSFIDELNGNVSFFNVVLQSDSIQQRIIDEDSSDNIIYRVRIGELLIKRADIPKFLTGTYLQAKSIEIINPVIHLTRMGNKDRSFSKIDSLALYEKILGNFKSIKAGEISIKGGNLTFSNKNESPHTSLNNIDISVKNFKIDSTKDYQNLVSYFVKGVVAKVGEVVVKDPGKDQLNFSNVIYDAGNRLIRIGNFQQKNNKGKLVSYINNIVIDGLATNTFINEQKLIANELSTGGGQISVYKKRNAKKAVDIELDSSLFDKAVINKISVGKTKVLIFDREKPAEPPSIINNVTFKARDIPVITSGNTFKNIITASKWVLEGDGLTTETENKLYKITIGLFEIDKDKLMIKVKKIWFMPQITEDAFIKSRKVQEDLYDLQFNDIVARGVDITALLEQRSLLASNVTVQPIIKIFSDRTLPPDPRSKLGKYPHQSLKKLQDPFNINRISLQNGYVSYREKGTISAQIGQIFFEKLNASLLNVTNIPAIFNNTPSMVFNATTKFMGVSNFNTKWKLPLNSIDGSFTLDGKLDAIDGMILNGALEPLGMASVRKGNVKSFNFHTTGNDLTAHTTSTLLYNNLKLEVLKKNAGENDLKKKGAISFLANIFIRDENPHNGITRKNDVVYKRDITRSFFNLVWKSMFTAIKKTIIGKSNSK